MWKSPVLDTTPPRVVRQRLNYLNACSLECVQDLPSGPPRVSGLPALTASNPPTLGGPSGRPCTPVNSIHSWVFSVTALGGVVSSKRLFLALMNIFNFLGRNSTHRSVMWYLVSLTIHLFSIFTTNIRMEYLILNTTKLIHIWPIYKLPSSKLS